MSKPTRHFGLALLVAALALPALAQSVTVVLPAPPHPTVHVVVPAPAPVVVHQVVVQPVPVVVVQKGNRGKHRGHR